MIISVRSVLPLAAVFLLALLALRKPFVNFDFFLLAPDLDMSDDEIVLDGTKEDGTVEQKRVKRDATELRVRFLFSFVVASRIARSPQLGRRQLVAVSDNIVQLSLVTKLWVRHIVVFVSLR